jgi:hypothetical protein
MFCEWFSNKPFSTLQASRLELPKIINKERKDKWHQ